MHRAVVLAVLLGACSFEPTGLAQDPAADGAVADVAIGFDGAPVDAPGPTVDARPIDAAPAIDAQAGCPLDYVLGYRYIQTPLTWRAAELDCENDRPGRTHLAVIGDPTELFVVRQFPIADETWIGVLRDRSSDPDPQAWEWRYVTGEDATFLPWAQNEPDNGSGQGFVVRLDKSDGTYYDRQIDATLPALCECDGRPAVDADYDD